MAISQAKAGKIESVVVAQHGLKINMVKKKNPNTISEIRTRNPQIVRAAAIPLDHCEN